MSERSSVGSISRTLSWAKDAGALVLTIVTALLYLALRLPTSIYLARLGASPEDIGIGYTELLLRSSIGVIGAIVVVLFGLVVLALFVVPFAINRRFNSMFSIIAKVRGNVEEMSDQDFEESAAVLRDELAPQFPEIFEANGLTIDEVLRRGTRRRELARQAELTPDEKQELLQLRRRLGHRFSFFYLVKLISRSAIRQALRGMVIGSLVIVTFAVLPVFASIEAGRVRDGRRPSIVAEQLLGYKGEPVAVFAASTTPPAEVQRVTALNHLFLLGSTSAVVILYDSDSDTTIRVPVDALVIVSRP